MSTHPGTPTCVTLPHGHHIKELAQVTGYQSVTSDTSELIRVRMLETSRDNSIMVVTGRPGLGKSFMTARAAEACASDPVQPTDVVWVELSHVARGRTLSAELFKEITGTQPLRTATAVEMRDELAEVLRDHHRLIVLDEAQHVTAEAMRVLRWLVDKPATDAALVIVGLPGIWKKMAPEMRSRTRTRLQIDAIADDEIVAILAAYHPLFATASPELLRTINKTRARGRFRWWAHFLSRAVRYAAVMGVDTVTAELVDAVCDDMPRGA